MSEDMSTIIRERFRPALRERRERREAIESAEQRVKAARVEADAARKDAEAARVRDEIQKRFAGLDQGHRGPAAPPAPALDQQRAQVNAWLRLRGGVDREVVLDALGD